MRTLALLLLTVALPAAAQAIRVKEIASVQGVRSNQLTGYGLVVGLDGTGDQTTQMPYTSQSLNNYLQQLGLSLPPGANMQLKNVAAVMVTAQLPAFAQPGQTIDVTVSSVGNAKSLRGGTLITTPLKGADGEIYALAQGNLLVGGAGASAGGSKVQINHLSAGRVPGGAQVERAVATPFALGDTIDLGLSTNDFQTASRVTSYDFGAATSNAYGTGNEVSIGNNDRYLEIDNSQVNSGGVEVASTFEGTNGYDAYVAAEAVGNSVTGYACSACDGTMDVTNAQTNSGNVSATASTTIRGSGRAVATGANAVGNTATFYVSRPGT